MNMPRAVLISLGFLLSLLVFAITAGVDEYNIVSSGVKTLDGKGGLRPLTQDEIWRDARYAAQSSIPSAILGCGILLGASCITRRCWPQLPMLGVLLFGRPSGAATMLGALLFGCPAGAAMGAALSILVWMIFGGWGPPFFLPSILAGVVITGTVAATAPGGSGTPPNADGRDSEPGRGTIACPHCGRVNSVHSRICPRCERGIGIADE
jgi:hypothetical protein